MLAATLCGAVLFGGCDDDGGDPSSPTTAPERTASAAPSPAAVPPLPEQIGVRGDLPSNDPIDLAARYGLTDGRAPASKPFGGEANVGDSRQFHVTRISGAAFSGDVPPENAIVTATLAAKSEHAYFWVDDVLTIDPSQAQAAADAFEGSVWPTITDIFGTPVTPGVDGDPRIVVLQADLGGAVGGYVSPDDGFLQAVRPLSNEAEIIYMDRTLRLGGAAFNVVLAHELQHLVHSNVDGNEEAWINEGISEAASGLVGGVLSSVDSFAVRPTIQLNAWGSEGAIAHYGAGAAFTRYLSHRFGDDETLGDIARAEGDGAQGVEEFLEAADQDLSFHEVFADWATANILNRLEGPYANPEGPVDVRVENSLSLRTPVNGEASQFGTDYYLVDPLEAGEYVLRFEGAAEVNVLPTTATDGGPMLWSNAQDDIDTTLTRAVDLTDASAPVLTFRTWFDIEPWYDWGYVSVSTDDGETWRALAGDHTTLEDPVEMAYGAGYTGTSGGGEIAAWVDERIDLAEFEGQKILVRFEYVTDGSTHGEGWAIDDVAIEDAGFDDPDGTDPDWEFAGWVRIDAPLSQTWIVRLIAEREDGEPAVMDAELNANGGGTLRFDTTGLQDVVLAIAGSTEGTNQPAPYTIELTRP